MRQVSISDIAKLAGVSLATAERAINGRAGVHPATKERVLQIAHEMNYQPNLVARTLASRRGPTLVGLCTPRELQFFFDEIRTGAMQVAREFGLYGLRLVQSSPDSLTDDVTGHVDSLIESGAKGILLFPGEKPSARDAVERAEKRGIRVVCCVTDLPQSKRSSSVFIDQDTVGALAGELLGKFVPANSRVAVMTGSLEIHGHQRKTEGFRRAFSHYCDGGQIVKVIEAHDDPILAYQMIESLLNEEPNLAGLFVGTANCLPACHSLTARRASRKVQLITTDLFKQMKPFFENGTIAASLYQSPFAQGRRAMRILVDLLLFGASPESSYRLSPAVVMASNVQLFREMQSRGDISKNYDEIPSETAVPGG